MISNEPLIALCVTCKGRAQHLKQTLPKNLEDNRRYSRVKFVILDYASQDDLQEYLTTTENFEEIKRGRLVVYSYPTAGAFNMTHAKNMAHRCGILERADILVNLDADNYTGPDFANYVAEQFRAHGPNTFLWACMIKGQMSRGISGRIVVTKQQFLNTGGYDEKYETWSPDDKDFNMRLRRLGYQGIEIDPRFLDAVRHTDKMRFKEYKHAAEAMNADAFDLAGQTNTIANFGKFGRGLVYRNYSSINEIFLDDVPTRIFGIGMHKTATTSLHMAMKILGIDSAHWVTAHWARAVWEEMQAAGRSLTLEKHYALSDLPIPLLYKELDRAYPGSKFILTIRDEARWLDSVRRHWSHEHNKFREGWSKDPFTHRVHKALYGQKGFDAEIFLARYRRHNAEVKEHFKDRPGDLLIMDIDRGAKWEPLCSFLNEPIPASPYPTVYKSERRETNVRS